MGFKIKPKSAKGLRRDWRADKPPKRFRVRVQDAIDAAGNPNQLANALGLTRSAVYQWLPPYRHDPYMPIKAAITFLDNDELRSRWEEIREDDDE